MESKKRILVAPLNWGLGHATRCIPVVNALIKNNYIPVLASDGAALELLKKEFSSLEAIELPEYQIEYPRNGKDFKKKLLLNTPRLLKVIQKEKKLVKKLVRDFELDGIISDNRFGIRSSKVPSVFITHQLNVLSGSTTWLSSLLHQQLIAKYDECWIPDVANDPNLSGKLGHTDRLPFPIKYLGTISRFKKVETPKKYDLLVLLSGPEPQRSLLCNQLKDELTHFKGNILFVKGKVNTKNIVSTEDNITFHNFMTSKELEIAINSSKLILSRSGYTTILDLAALEKKAFFIPTPGQFEQEYLAKRLQEENLIPYCKQEDFTLDELKRVKNFNGLKSFNQKVDWSELFRLFECKREFAPDT